MSALVCCLSLVLITDKSGWSDVPIQNIPKYSKGYSQLLCNVFNRNPLSEVLECWAWPGCGFMVHFGTSRRLQLLEHAGMRMPVSTPPKFKYTLKPTIGLFSQTPSADHDLATSTDWLHIFTQTRHQNMKDSLWMQVLVYMNCFGGPPLFLGILV